MSNTISSSEVNSTAKRSTETTGQIATKLFHHPSDQNMAATFDGRIWTRYVAHKRGGVIGEWRELTQFTGAGRVNRKSSSPQSATMKSSVRKRDVVTIPWASHGKLGLATNRASAGRLCLACYLGRRLESWEVCRHGIAGPNDHSYLNVSPGDAVNNMIDDLENGKSETSLTYLIQAQNRITRLISGLTSTKPTT